MLKNAQVLPEITEVGFTPMGDDIILPTDLVGHVSVAIMLESAPRNEKPTSKASTPREIGIVVATDVSPRLKASYPIKVSTTTERAGWVARLNTSCVDSSAYGGDTAFISECSEAKFVS